MQIFRQKKCKKNTIFHTLKNRAKIEKKMQENHEKLYISFGNVVQMVLPIIVGRNTDFANKGLSVTNNTVTFHGTINPKNLSVNANYLFLVANNRLATASAGGDMLGLRGYFTVNGELPAKAVISFREGVTTGTTSTVTPTTDGVQKVLQNQQILIIRDGEIYNILGEHINTK